MTDDALSEFVSALNTLSAYHGVGIAGAPVLFIMEYEDNGRLYQVNDDSELTFEWEETHHD